MVFFYVILGILLLCLLLLCLPITITAGYTEHFWLRARYAFFRIYPRKEKSKQKKNPKKQEKCPKQSKKDLNYFNELFKKNSLPDAISELCALLSLALQNAAKILRLSSMRHFTLQITYSNADAAAAAIGYGRICAVVYPFLGFLNSLISFNKQNISIYCDYSGDKNNFTLDLKYRLIPLFCVGPLLSFILDYIKRKGRYEYEREYQRHNG